MTKYCRCVHLSIMYYLLLCSVICDTPITSSLTRSVCLLISKDLNPPFRSLKQDIEQSLMDLMGILMNLHELTCYFRDCSVHQSFAESPSGYLKKLQHINVEHWNTKTCFTIRCRTCNTRTFKPLEVFRNPLSVPLVVNVFYTPNNSALQVKSYKLCFQSTHFPLHIIFYHYPFMNNPAYSREREV